MRKLNLLIAAAAPAIVIAMLTAAPARATSPPNAMSMRALTAYPATPMT